MEAKSIVRTLVSGAALYVSIVGAGAEDTVIMKQSPSIVPEVTTITKKTVVAPSIIQTDVTPALTPSVTVRRTESSSSVVQSNPLPEYERRLTLMKEQIDLGLSKGWLSAAQADGFKTRLVDLTGMKDNLKSQAFDSILSDSIEKQLTALNIEISDALKNANMIGSPPGIIK